jgi:hypothetical protein
MAQLVWNSVGSRFYESGVDRGVLYVDTQPGVAWNGLTSVNETPSGGDATPYYIDGVKYLNMPAGEEFEATITAFTYPDLFSECDGTYQPRSGLYITQQRRKPFGFSYRSMIGSDLTPDHGYKIHMVYNALAEPTERSNSTTTDNNDLNDFSWKITTKPPAMDGYRPTSHVVMDSRFTDPTILSLVEDILYGTDEESARLPNWAELLGVYDSISSLTVVDNGDGTWTATAPFDVIRMTGSDTFEITSSAAEYIDDDTYTLTSE